MEIEKTLAVSAPRERVWALLMDPRVMTGAVPGMQSIDVISPTEYVALMKVKISFLSAKFKLHTHIVEQREPEYLRVEGTGEDASVASSLKQTSEIFLSETPQGGTELKIKVNVDLLGRLGTFGLSVMKTKADRMWDEFGKNLAARLEGKPEEAATSQAQAGGQTAEPQTAGAARRKVSGEAARSLQSPAMPPVDGVTAGASAVQGGERLAEEEPRGWFSRLLGNSRPTVGRTSASAAAVIRVEVRQIDRTVAVEWPVEAAGQCQEWLRDLLAGRGGSV
ncbi:4-hydroxybenzoyl-CoA reductase [Pusillimonas caeni]|uniref:CoxG family protein n=1 Tax=Pusillimonas caeni TaxID=1348472 RepID=UPI000E59B390|nr:SRPBCC family protein [Pusillimonas caeni]TFL15193.1 4-hydroxybenzoyl-CoA reductase [Pusillimonas caeni]